MSEFKGAFVQKDEEGFSKSFSIEEMDEAKDFFNRFGLVIFREVLNPTEIEDSIEGVWQEANCVKEREEQRKLQKQKEQQKGEKETVIEKEISEDNRVQKELKRNDPSTWGNLVSSSSGALGHDICTTKASWEVRQNEKIYEAFRGILGTDDLLVSADRYGIMRPTKNVRMNLPDDHQQEVIQDHPEWRTRGPWFHWDLNPWTFDQAPKLSLNEEISNFCDDNGRLKWDDDKEAAGLLIRENNERSKAYFGDVDKVQGMVAFEDSQEMDGGFQCVPGFNHFVFEWAKKNPQSTDAGFVNCPPNDPDIFPFVQKITMRKGSLLIWSGYLPHCNYPNESSRFRLCQYIKMFPRSVLPLHVDGYFEGRCHALKKRFPKDFTVSKTGQQVFGFHFIN